MEIGKTRNYENTALPCGSLVSTQFLVLPISTRVAITCCSVCRTLNFCFWNFNNCYYYKSHFASKSFYQLDLTSAKRIQHPIFRSKYNFIKFPRVQTRVFKSSLRTISILSHLFCTPYTGFTRKSRLFDPIQISRKQLY